MAKRDKVIRDSDREYAEFKACEAQDFGSKAKTLVVSCIPCNKRVELPMDDAILTFHIPGKKIGHIQLKEFVSFSHIQCKDCLGVADIEVI